MRVLAVMVAVLFADTSLAFAQGIGLVPPNLLRGQTLYSEDENFSIEAPAGWTWLVTQNADTRFYACRRGADGPAFIVQTQPDSRLRMPADGVAEYADGVAKTLRGSGARGVYTEHSRSDRLFPHGHRFTGSFVLANGTKGQVRGYVGVRGRFYAVHTVLTGDAAQAEAFEQFATTFRLLHPVPNVPTLSIGLTLIPVALIAMTLWLAYFVCPWPPRLRRITLLFAIVAVLLMAYLGAAWVATFAGHISADDLDKTIGFASGLSFAALVVTLIVTTLQKLRRPAAAAR
jgi:hypothetical protein